MLRHLLHVRTGIASGLLAFLPGPALAQPPGSNMTFTVPLFQPAPLDEKQVKTWARELVARIDDVWTETKPALRDQKLLRLSENTPSEMAFVTRVFKRNQPSLSAVTLTSLKDVFAVVRNTNWDDRDAGHVQKVVAGWSVMLPELIKMLGQDDSTTEIRHATEAVLVSLGSLSRDSRLGSPLARQTWHGQLPTLAKLTSHPKSTVRLAALHTLEALGSDAAPASGSIVQALGDTDRFVRWSAVQTLKAVGMDKTALQAVAALQKDDDTDVREAAVALVLAQPGGTELLAQTKNASPIRRASLEQPLLAKRLTAPLPRFIEAKETKPAEIVNAPSQRTTTSVAVTPAAKPADMANAPVRQPNELRHVFTSSTPSPELARSGNEPPAPTLPKITSEPPVKATPMFAPPAAPTRPVALPSAPRNLAPPPALAVPTPSPTRSPEIRTVSAPAESVKIDLTELWLKKLANGSSAEQILALRTLGKMKQGAGHCVPQMAELLVKGDVTVRREVPLALLQIGAPARVATSLLERALNDGDTEVKVNAARCLVELAATK